MMKKNYKGRVDKRKVEKCEGVCRTLAIKKRLRDIENLCVERHNDLRSYMTMQINDGLSAAECDMIRKQLQKMRDFRAEICNVEELIEYATFLIKKGTDIVTLKQLQRKIQNNILILLHTAVNLWFPLNEVEFRPQ